MSRRTTLFLSVSGAEPRELMRELDRLELLPRTPDVVEVDFEDRKPTTSWLESWLPTAGKLCAMTDDGHAVSFDRDGVVALRRPDTELGDPATFELIGRLPFELAAIGQTYAEWWDEDYRGYSFSEGHVTHGWACAFRGSGYDRLVSRRWLDFGPWCRKEVAGATWIEFHDLEADPSTALAQAQPGWQRMGIGDEGGFVQNHFVYEDDVGGVYEPAERKLKVMVPSGEVSQRKMLEIAAIRRDPRIQRERAIERTAFVFLDRANAERHLHELWLREHECWAIVDGREHRLDEVAPSTPSPPAWCR